MTEAEKKREEDFKAFRAKWCIVWVLSNLSFGYVINAIDQNNEE